ncbi:MAG TPA: thymidine phosphorylase [Verrucomicrobiae bacterium]
MNFLSLIEAKRDGRTLTSGQVEELIKAYVAGRIPDYQMAAFLMAVYFRGLDEAETRALTLAMRDSGDRLAFPADPRPLVDKHSTGGVGDKVSLALTPLLACLGFRVPMISGRGLGITGGTLDKLESIPGFQTALTRERITQIVQSVGCVICGQTDTMVPADKRLYALRDVTGTVPSIPLIVASILSKKLAEGLDALILDVKFGAAAFMPTCDDAGRLAREMVALGSRCGVNTRAMLTRMDAPLGRAAGNWLEVKEAVALLDCQTGGPRLAGDARDELGELVIACAAHLLVQTGKSTGFEAAQQQAEQCLASGQPREKWDEMLRAQGANPESVARELEKEGRAPVMIRLRAERTGFVSRCDARLIGEVIRDLGAGRLTKDSQIDPYTGIDEIAKTGDFLEAGAVLARIHAQNGGQAESAMQRLAAAFEMSPAPVAQIPVIAENIGQTEINWTS